MRLKVDLDISDAVRYDDWQTGGSSGRPVIAEDEMTFAEESVAAPVRCSWQGIDRSLVASARAVKIA